MSIPLCSAIALALACATARAEESPRSIAIRPDALGYNNNFIRGGTWTDARVVDAFKNLHPGNLRYPAGTLANYWDWKTGGINQSLPNLPHGWKQTRAKPYRLAEFKIVHEATGVTPIWVLNMLTSGLDEQLAMLKAAKELDLPVTCVELGNEYYLQSPAYVAKYPTAQDYAREANRWTSAIKEVFPEVRIAAVGAAARQGDDARRKTWNEKIYPLLKNVDAITFHIYQGSGLGNIDALMEAAGLVKEVGARKKEMWETQAAQDAQWQVFQTDNGLRNMLSMPFARVAEFKEMNTLPAGFCAWITEFNLFDRNGPVRGTWAHGLITAGLTLNLLNRERIDLLSFHDAYGEPLFAAIFNNDHGFEGLLSSAPPETVPYALTASGRACQLIGRATHGMPRMETLEFSSNPVINGRVPYPALLGATFSGPGGHSAIVVNFSQSPMSIDSNRLPGWAKGANSTSLSGDPRTYVVGPSSLRTSTTTLDLQLIVPSYGLVMLETKN